MQGNGRHRIALLGCGRVAQHYVKILTEYHPIDAFEIVACCDLIEEKAAATAASLGGAVFSDLDDMLENSKPDLVFVLSRSGDHDAHARSVLEAGSHAIIEKPIALNPDKVTGLEALARERNLMFGGVFQNRYNPAMICLADAMRNGRFGRIVTATVRLRWCRTQDYYEDGWHGTWKQDGGVANQQAIHHIDALNWICGPVEAVCASATKRLNRLEAEDTITAVVRFSNQALGTIEATTAARPEDFEASLSVVGETGMAEIGGVALNRIELWQFVEPLADDVDVPEKFSQEVPTGYGLGHGPFMADLAERLNAGSIEAPISAGEAVKAVELVHALYASAEREAWVKLRESPRSSRLGVG